MTRSYLSRLRSTPRAGTPSGASLCTMLALGIAACTNKAAEPGCLGEHTLAAVAADADPAGPIYVADSISDLPGKYVVERAGTLAPVFRGIADGSVLALLAPSSGGVILVNGGAAARRFSASGTLLWTIGYGAVAEVRATLTTADRVFVADIEGVRAYDLDAELVFKHALPNPMRNMLEAISDLKGGAWVLGVGDISAWLDEKPTGAQPPNLFVAHFDADGALLGVRAWEGSDDARDSQVVMSTGDDGTPRLLVESRPYGGSIDVTALDETGAPLWNVMVPDGQPLQSDAAGIVFSIRNVGDAVDVERWDTKGAVDASATVVKAALGATGAALTTAAGPDGIVVAGTWFGPEDNVMCPRGHFLYRVRSADLGVTPVALGMP